MSKLIVCVLYCTHVYLRSMSFNTQDNATAPDAFLADVTARLTSACGPMWRWIEAAYLAERISLKNFPDPKYIERLALCELAVRVHLECPPHIQLSPPICPYPQLVALLWQQDALIKAASFSPQVELRWAAHYSREWLQDEGAEFGSNWWVEH